MIIKYIDFLILEKNNLAKKYIDENNIPEEKINKIRELLKSNPNLFYNFLKYHVEEEVPITTEELPKEERGYYYASLENMIKYIQNNKQKLKNFLPKDLIQYDSYEDLYDATMNAGVKSLIKKNFVDKLPSKLRKQVKIKDITEDFISVVHAWASKDKELFTPAIKFDKIGDYMKHLKDTVNEIDSGFDKNKVDELKKWTGKEDIELIYDKDKVLVFRTINPIFIKKYGSQRWCIVNAMSQYFKRYIDPRSGNTQYLIFNFNYKPTERYHKFGITLDKNGKTLDGASQDASNSPHDFSKILELNGLPEDLIVPHGYSDEIIDKFEEIAKYSSISATLTEEVFLKYKEYFILDGDVFANAFHNDNMFELFLKHGVDPNMVDDDGLVPIIHMVDSDDYDKVEMLIKYGADVNKVNSKGRYGRQTDSALMAACKRGNENMFKLLVDNGADINYVNKNGESALKIASKAQNYSNFKYLLDNINEDLIDKLDVGKLTPFYSALNAKNITYIKDFITKGIDINQSVRSNGVNYLSALIVKYDDKDLTLMKMLIKYGIDINHKDHDGNTIIHRMMIDEDYDKVHSHRSDNPKKLISNKLAMIGLIVKNGFDLLVENNKKLNPLSYLIIEKNGTDDETIELVDVLLGENIDLINSVMKDGESILQKAINEYYTEIIDTIIYHAKNNKMSLDINREDSFGDTVLHTTLEHPEYIKEFISLGAKVDYKGENGDTPLLHACKFGLTEAVDVLLKNGANVHEPNDKGNTPLYIAAIRGKLDVVKQLINYYIQNEIEPSKRLINNFKANYKKIKEVNDKVFFELHSFLTNEF